MASMPVSRSVERVRGRLRALRFAAVLALTCCGAPARAPEAPVGGAASAPSTVPSETPSSAPSAAPSTALPSTAGDWTVLLDGRSLDGWEVTSFGGEGPVEIVDGAVRLGMGMMLTGLRYPHENELPRDEYELEVVAARLLGTDFFCGLTFPVGDAHATLVLGGWGGALTGLSCLDGLDASDNETRGYRSFARGRDYVVRVRVAAGRIQAWVDGESVVDVARAGRKVSLRAEVVKSQPLGISSYATVARIRSLKLRRLEARP
jgi:3-keto-disaccharide hydrolase